MTKARITRMDRIKKGQVEPVTSKERETYNIFLNARGRKRTKALHDMAAIRKGNLSAGKIVVIPPSV